MLHDVSDLARVVQLLAYLPVAVGLSWWAGQVIAVEEWWGGTRRRFENWAYRDGDKVRAGHPDAEEFWDRARPWYLFGGEEDPQGRRLRPARRRNRWVTALRTKAADMVGCPRCCGWWGGLIVGLVFAVWLGPWPMSGGWLAVHAAGWGAARKLDWAEP